MDKYQKNNADIDNLTDEMASNSRCDALHSINTHRSGGWIQMYKTVQRIIWKQRFWHLLTDSLTDWLNDGRIFGQEREKERINCYFNRLLAKNERAMMRARDAATIGAALHCSKQTDVETIYLINLQINIKHQHL